MGRHAFGWIGVATLSLALASNITTTTGDFGFEGVVADFPDLDGPPCVHLPCAGVASGPFEGPADDFIPDRRPVLRISLFGAHYQHGLTGLPLWWLDATDDGTVVNNYHAVYDGNGIPDSVDVLLRKLDNAVGDGWQRIALKLPAGQMPGGDVPSSQWWTMPEWKRDALSEHLGGWIAAHPLVEVSIYIGSTIKDPCSLQANGAYLPDPTNPDHMCIVYQNLGPWIDLGIGHVWLDGAGASASRVDMLEVLAGSPNYDGVRFGGEPAPSVRIGSGNWVADTEAMTRSSFMVTQRYLQEHVRGFGDNDMWTVDPATTEVGVGFAPLNPAHPQADIDRVHEFVQHGFVPWAFDKRSAEYVRRIHGMGDFDCPTDLDANGIVDAVDLTRLLGNWGTTDATIYHGDVTADGRVDFADLLTLLQSFGLCD